MKKIVQIVPIFLIIILIGSFALHSCKHQTVDPSSLRTVCFEKEVLPIFQTSCAMTGCHGGAGGDGSDQELYLGDYNGIVSNVTPGNPDQSRLYQTITSRWENTMPPKPYNPLNELQRTLIYTWIKQGATKCDTTKMP